jgi:undecaprenyl diphosphate synthase
MENKKTLTPRCVGFVMDGNRRFAREQNQPVFFGHVAGKEKFIEVANWVVEAGIPHGVFYVFSTENWKRSSEEVEQLLSLMLLDLQGRVKAKIKVIGQINDLPKAVQENITKHELASLEKGYETTIWLAISYGGRAEILEAVNQAVAKGVPVTEEEFSKLMWSGEMPDPDLIIRTGGERRLSNFLPWQSIYSELFFTDTYWPAFSREEFSHILADYSKRERRMGQ